MAAFMYLLHNTSLRPPRWVLTRGRVMKGTANFVGRRGLRDGDKSRGELWVKGWVREGGQRQKWKKKKEEVSRADLKQKVCSPPLFFPPLLGSPPLPLSAVTLTGLVIGRGPCFLSLFLFPPSPSLSLPLPHGSAPQWEPWGPEIADDKIGAVFHSAQGYPTLSWQLKSAIFRGGVC